MQKLGLKAVAGVAKVTIRKQKGVVLNITRPDVFKTPGGETYIVFGEVNVEDVAASASAAAEKMRQMGLGGAGGTPDFAALAAKERSARAPAGGADAGDDADETGLEAKDIELVMTQASVSRTKAVAALRKNNGDIVNAIIELTSA